MKIYYGRFRFQCCLTFIERFKQKDNMISTSAITAFTNSSMKSGSGATANCYLCSSGEKNGKQRRIKLSFGRTMMQALKLLRLAKRCVLARSNVEQGRNKAHSLSGINLCLSDGIS